MSPLDSGAPSSGDAPPTGAPEGPDVDALLRELDRSLHQAEQSVSVLRAVGGTLLGNSPQAQENRAMLVARSHLSRQRFEELAVRYESLRAEFLRLRGELSSPEARSPTPEPAVVRRAASYLEDRVAEHANREGPMPTVPISEVAQAAGVGVRALQQSFRRYRGTTPTGYLRDLRYDRVHRELEQAESSDGIAVVASRWGFTHASHFAAGYRRRYGRSPRDTLRA